ncbi:MAG: UDP-N-acetylglucosamine--N-acetylmuramyl-(pentapeptide) pyrophosphoryl-undecaprenol N-acetylglucosamine transferase [Planctomycetota bacterium]|jgi:UDP-N-acetylglucosamine--N-acetylmuramyl-(pentapeptide) pyrophosphoryl-undecaprenol N-acetylglucosamine transferase
MPEHTFLFAGGGSGGHVFPGVAIAEGLTHVEPKARALFLCSQRPVDRAILTEANVPFTAVPARSPSLRPLAAKDFVQGFWRSVQTARKLLHEAHIDRVVALGGFVAAPAVVAARTCRRPVTVVNLDVRPGRANRWLMRHCQQVLAAVSVAGPDAPRFADRVVGMPLRRQALAPGDRGDCRSALGLNPGTPTLLVTGASQGAASLNDLMVALARQHPDMLSGWQVLHLAGNDRDASVRAAYDAAGIDAAVTPFLSHMGLAWGAADLAISRAGANSVAEAAANGVPALFMPYPYHRDMHQRHNAELLVAGGGAIIEVDRVDPVANVRGVRPALESLLRDRERRDAMRRNLQARRVTGGAEMIARILLGEKVAETGPRGCHGQAPLAHVRS